MKSWLLYLDGLRESIIIKSRVLITIYNKGKTPEFTYPIYKIMYQCMKSKIPNRKGKKITVSPMPILF